MSEKEDFSTMKGRLCWSHDAELGAHWFGNKGITKQVFSKP